jgi:hypothetical protein
VANERLLALAKPYPGAILLRVESTPYNSDPGYITAAYYRLDRRVPPQDIAAFYSHELRGWRVRISHIPCMASISPGGASSRPCPSETHVDLSKGKATISLELGDTNPSHGAKNRSASYSVEVLSP